MTVHHSEWARDALLVYLKYDALEAALNDGRSITLPDHHRIDHVVVRSHWPGEDFYEVDEIARWLSGLAGGYWRSPSEFISERDINLPNPTNASAPIPHWGEPLREFNVGDHIISISGREGIEAIVDTSIAFGGQHGPQWWRGLNDIPVRIIRDGGHDLSDERRMGYMSGRGWSLVESYRNRSN